MIFVITVAKNNFLEEKLNNIIELLNKIFKPNTSRNTSEELTEKIISIIGSNRDIFTYTLAIRFREISCEFFNSGMISLTATIGFVKTLLNNEYMSEILSSNVSKTSKTFLSFIISCIDNTKSVYKFVKAIFNDKYLSKDVVSSLLFRFNYKIIAKLFKEYKITDRDLLDCFSSSTYLYCLLPYINFSNRKIREEYFSKILAESAANHYYFDRFDTLIDGLSKKNYKHFAKFVADNNLSDKLIDSICNYIDTRFNDDDRHTIDRDLKIITKFINLIDNLKSKLTDSIFKYDHDYLDHNFMIYFVNNLGISERVIFNKIVENGDPEKMKTFIKAFPEYKSLAMLT